MSHEQNDVTHETADERKARFEASYAALPDKPSELIRLALADLQAVRNDPRFVVDMDLYYERDAATGTCAVCLGGAVIARHVKPNPLDAGDPFCEGPYYYKGTKKIFFLDLVRRIVEWRWYAFSLDVLHDEIPFYLPLAFETNAIIEIALEPSVTYEHDPEAFIAAVERVACAFEASGQ